MTSGCFLYSALFGSTLDTCYVSLRRLLCPRCSASWPLWTRRTVLRSFPAVACARLVFLVILHLALFFSPSCCQAHMLGILADMVQMNRYVARFWCPWFRLQKTVESPQLQSIKIVDFVSVVHRPIPTVLATMEIPQLHVDMVVVSLVAGRALLPCREQRLVPWSKRLVRPPGFPSCFTQ